ncbi:MAG TPA: hypothetical protein VF820_01275 [Patescibacteria group bacterium]
MNENGLRFGELLKLTLIALNIRHKDLIYLMDTEYVLDPSIVSKWVRGVARPTREHYCDIVKALCNKTKEIGTRGYTELLNELEENITGYIKNSDLSANTKNTLLKYEEVDKLLKEVYDFVYYLNYNFSKSNNEVLLSSLDELNFLDNNTTSNLSCVIYNDAKDTDNLEIVQVQKSQEIESCTSKPIFFKKGRYIKRHLLKAVFIFTLLVASISFFTTQYKDKYLVIAQNTEHKPKNVSELTLPISVTSRVAIYGEKKYENNGKEDKKSDQISLKSPIPVQPKLETSNKKENDSNISGKINEKSGENLPKSPMPIQSNSEIGNKKENDNNSSGKINEKSGQTSPKPQMPIQSDLGVNAKKASDNNKQSNYSIQNGNNNIVIGENSNNVYINIDK